MSKEYIKVQDVYPITVTTYPPDADNDKPHVSMDYILDSHIEQYTPPVKRASLSHFLNGQTRYMDGVYAHDVERWLNRLPNQD